MDNQTKDFKNPSYINSNYLSLGNFVDDVQYPFTTPIDLGTRTSSFEGPKIGPFLPCGSI